MNNLKKKSLDEIQIARAFAIFAVLIVHSSSSGVTNIEPDSILFPIYNFFNIAGKLGTPTFIMLSSFVLFYNYFPREVNRGLIKRFYVKRLKFIIIPYVIFSLLYFVIKMYVYYDYPNISYAINRFLLLLALGKAHTHLYFVFISVQFYLLFPLLLVVFKKSLFLRKYAIIIGLIVQWIWVLLNDAYFHIPWKGSVSLSYLSFYFIGAYLGIYYTDLKNKFKQPFFKDRIIIPLSIGYGVILILYTGYMYLVRTNVFPAISENLPYLVASYLGEFTWATYALFAGLLLFYLAHITNKTFSPKTKLFFMEIGATSFGIYLIHPLFLMIFRQFVSSGSPIVYHSWQVITFFLVTFLSWFVVRLIFRITSYYWFIFGKMEQPHLLFKKIKKEDDDDRVLRKYS
ncbi:acyltransferase [Virgibacillus pantothenticus]|uniref:acyltransferase n=1 Tax=Virgibacillus pantothenticus TaxID=1473 RepID=UPI003D2E77CC